MASTQPLLRITGFSIGTRVQAIPAKAEVPAVEPTIGRPGRRAIPARPESSFLEAGVIVPAGYDGRPVPGVTSVLPIVLGPNDPQPSPGEEVDWLVAAYVSHRPSTDPYGKPYSLAAFRFVALAEAPAQQGSRQMAGV